MNRRSFFRAILASPLLRFLRIPVAPSVPLFAKAFDRDDALYAAISKKPLTVVSTREMRIPLELRPGGEFRNRTNG